MAWSGDLSTDIPIDISSKVLVGRESGESLQMVFSFVIVQPYEEVYLQRTPQ